MSIRVWAVFRAKIFSHHAIEADRAILVETLKELSNISDQSLDITTIDEEDFLNFDFSTLPDLVLTMAQAPEVLARMQILEKDGVRVINNSASIINCFRENLIQKIQTLEHSSYVSSEIIKTSELCSKDIQCWIKRGDFHATENTDVLFIKSSDQLEQVKKDFLKRNISYVVKQPHLTGKIIKFYGVKNSILDLRDMGISGFDRYNLRKNSDHYKIDIHTVEKKLAPILTVLNLSVYGGDLVLSEKNDFKFIDINDWPSFRTCREIASKNIAKLAMETLAP